MVSETGIEIKKTLLDGKPFQKIIDHARKTNPWLIVLGRIGVHSPKDESGAREQRGEHSPRRATATSSSPPASKCRGSTCAPRRPSAGRPRPRRG